MRQHLQKELKIVDMLFNRNNNGSEELQQVTGNWMASADYSIILPEISSATEDVCRLVGQAVIARAKDEYESMFDNHPLLDAVRLPVACLAMMRYAMLSGVGHDETGRKVKVNDNEKMPFEWMVDRDDIAMRERYYRAMDSLYLYLEEKEPELWEASPKKMSLKSSIVKNIIEFETVYPIQGSYYAYYMLQQLVIEAQSYIAKVFGDAWKSIVDSSAEPELIALARRAVILSALITAGERWTLEVFPIEIARRFSPTYQGNRSNRASTLEETEWYIKRLRRQLGDTLDEIRAAKSGTTIGELLPDNDPKNKYFTTI